MRRTRRRPRPVIVLIAAAAVVAAGAPPARAAAGAPAVEAVVGTAWLAERLSDPAVAVLDARPSLRDYLAVHIPGAQPLGVENVRSAAGGVPGQVFPPEVLSIIAGRLGLRRDGTVVVYGAGSDPDATFVATAFRLAGFESVAILNGGFERWAAEGRPTTGERGPTAVTRLRPRAATADLLAGVEDVRRALGSRTVVLIDARPPEQFEAGHIPGAVNRFWKKDLVTGAGPEAGLLRPAENLKKEYAALGITPEVPAIVYCNTGHMASSVFYLLRYGLGHPDVRLYDGSWVEWAMRPDLPKESAPAPPGP